MIDLHFQPSDTKHLDRLIEKVAPNDPAVEALERLRHDHLLLLSQNLALLTREVDKRR